MTNLRPAPDEVESHEPYRLAADTMGPDEIEAAKEVLDSGQLTMSRRVRAFEEEFADWVGADHAIMVNSGSSANLLIVDALIRASSSGDVLTPGDEVLVPGLAWPTTVWPLAQLGLIPVFVDVDPATLAIDLESARSVIGPRTRGMFVIHALGQAIDAPAYSAFCAEHKLVLLEDCCESLGAFSHRDHVGTTGVAASFSFYFSHHVSTIEGGMVITNDPGLADELRGRRAHGWVRDRSDRASWVSRYPDLDSRFLFATVGYNVRPTEINGAIGSVQLRRLDEMLVARESLARTVNDWLAASAPWLELIGAGALGGVATTDRRDRANSWMTLPLRLRPSAPMTRDALVAHFERHGVETRPIIAGNLARHPAVSQVRHRTSESMDTCDALLRDSLMIGCHPVVSSGSLATLKRTITSLRDG